MKHIIDQGDQIRVELPSDLLADAVVKFIYREHPQAEELREWRPPVFSLVSGHVLQSLDTQKREVPAWVVGRAVHLVGRDRMTSALAVLSERVAQW